MEEKIENIIKEIVDYILKKMGVDGEVSVVEAEEGDDNLVCDIKVGSDSNLIIGQNGENLRELQHIIRLLVRKKSESIVRFIVDVNSYKKEKNNSVIWLAKDMAERAVSKKRSVALRPMSAYERRIVHMTLAENEKVETESAGDGDDRKIIIKPVLHI